jgi:hypothetical protein
MKKSLVYLVTLSLLIFAVSCSEDDGGPDDTNDGGSAQEYYPGTTGSTFNYQGSTTDSSGTNQYTRDVNYGPQQTVNNTTYIQQNNTITTLAGVSTGDFLFRRTDTGMFIYIDATIFSEMLDSSGIDPSLVTITADPEIRLISYPFANTPQWDSFVVRVSAFGGLISLDVLKVTGNYRGQEQVTVMQQNMTAEKVEYVATIKIPESIEDIANPQTITVNATAWFVKDVGLVKLEGAGFLIGVLGGGDLDIEDESATASEVLVNYSIK